MTWYFDHLISHFSCQQRGYLKSPILNTKFWCDSVEHSDFFLENSLEFCLTKVWICANVFEFLLMSNP